MELLDQSLNEWLQQFHFELPKNLIAQQNIGRRHLAKLLVVNIRSSEISIRETRELDQILPQNIQIFYNASSVLASRVMMKAGSREHEVLFIDQDYDSLPIVKAKIRNIRRLKEGEFLEKGNFKFQFVGRDDQLGILECPFSLKSDLEKFLDQEGLPPSPPYMNQVEKLIDYQNPLGDRKESIAAPTSCYHLTPDLVERLGQKNFHKVYLRVGLGTFEPITNKEHLHSEKYEFPLDSLESWNSTNKENRMIVGTTALRVIESYTRSKNPVGMTDLFLQPGNPARSEFKYLLTNFHLPKSSLFILIASFLGKELAHRAYSIAIEQNFRFFSFGDAMLIEL